MKPIHVSVVLVVLIFIALAACQKGGKSQSSSAQADTATVADSSITVARDTVAAKPASDPKDSMPAQTTKTKSSKKAYLDPVPPDEPLPEDYHSSGSAARNQEDQSDYDGTYVYKGGSYNFNYEVTISGNSFYGQMYVDAGWGEEMADVEYFDGVVSGNKLYPNSVMASVGQGVIGRISGKSLTMATPDGSSRTLTKGY